MKSLAFLSGFFLLASILLSCADRAVSRRAPAPELKAGGIQDSPGESWKVKWDRTLQAGQKEGSVVIYASASSASALKEAISLFRQKFGINLELTTGRGRELIVKVTRERSAGLFIGDIFFGGLNTIYSDVKPSGVLDQLEPLLMLPEVLDPKVWYGGVLPLSDKGRYVFKWAAYPTAMLGINTDMVKPGEIKSYYDILDYRWKDRIIINDPTAPGTAFAGFASLIYNKIVDPDFFRKLVAQQSQILRDERLQVDWLARGKYPVALWPLTVWMAEFQKAGAPVAHIEVKEGVYLSAGGANLTLLKNAPHPNAASIFINWFLSKEGQMHMQKSTRVSSARVDLPTGDVDPLQLRDAGQKYFVSPGNIEEWVLNEQDKYLGYAKQIFSPLLK